MPHWNGITLAWRIVRPDRPPEQKRECDRERNTRLGYHRRRAAVAQAVREHHRAVE